MNIPKIFELPPPRKQRPLIQLSEGNKGFSKKSEEFYSSRFPKDGWQQVADDSMEYIIIYPANPQYFCWFIFTAR